MGVTVSRQDEWIECAKRRFKVIEATLRLFAEGRNFLGNHPRTTRTSEPLLRFTGRYRIRQHFFPGGSAIRSGPPKENTIFGTEWLRAENELPDKWEDIRQFRCPTPRRPSRSNAEKFKYTREYSPVAPLRNVSGSEEKVRFPSAANCSSFIISSNAKITFA